MEFKIIQLTCTKMRNEAPLGIPCKICWATMFHKLFQILLYFTYFLEVQIKEEKLKFSDACYVEQMIRPKRSDKYLYFFECRITSINVVNFHIREKVSEKKNQNLIFCVETLLSECKQLHAFIICPYVGNLDTLIVSSIIASKKKKTTCNLVFY